MPATMMHLLSAHMLWESAPRAFFLGSILPDCVDRDRALKDRLHFRDIEPEKRETALIDFGKKLDLARPFDLGALWHLYLDFCWDRGPQKQHRSAYRGEKWFLDYRHEISLAGSYIAHTEPWGQAIWLSLHSAAPEEWQNSLKLPEEDIREFLDFNFHWHTEVSIGPSEIFTPKLIQGFMKDSIARFEAFLAENFMPLSKIFRDCYKI